MLEVNSKQMVMIAMMTKIMITKMMIIIIKTLIK